MNTIIREYTQFDERELRSLYASVGWTNYTDHPQWFRPAFSNSLRILAAWDGETLVGLCRAVGDGITIVYIQDLLVHPEYQRHGLGRQLLGRMLEEYKHVYQKCLLTDESTVSFYEKMGLQMVSEAGCRALFG